MANFLSIPTVSVSDFFAGFHDASLITLPSPEENLAIINKGYIFDSHVPEILRNACLEVLAPGINLFPDFSTRKIYSSPPAWIAGGAIRSRIANDGESDYDLFFSHAEHLNYTFYHLTGKYSLQIKPLVNDNTVLKLASSIGNIDLVKKYYGLYPEHCISRFDFTVCCLAIDINHIVYWHKDALQDIKDRRLRLVDPINPLGTLLRTQKYAKKGYTMDLESNMALTECLSKNIETIKEEYSRLSGRALY